jgi:hypothetical protein
MAMGLVLCLTTLATSGAYAIDAERTASRQPCCASMHSECGARLQQACCIVSDAGREALAARTTIDVKPDQSIVAAAFFHLEASDATSSRLSSRTLPLPLDRSTRLLASVFRI